MQKFLLGQLGANGDCLYATILARQLRRDHPSAHITWGISSHCAGLLRNNPFVDEIWEIPIYDWDEHALMWGVFEREAMRRVGRHEFDHAVLSQIWPNNFQNFDGTIRPSILRAYGKPITVPIENVIWLTEEEEERVDRFVRDAGAMSFEHRILFECSAKSGQSFVTPDLAQEVAEHVYQALPNATILFSTNLPIRLKHANSRYAGTLSLRETGGLTRSCTLFIGAGSGGTVAATSTAATRLPMVTLLHRHTSVFASFAHDFEYFGLPNDHMLEMTEMDPAKIATCIVTVCRDGIGAARLEFGGDIPVNFDYYFNHIRHGLMRTQRYLDAAQSLTITAARYGWRPELVAFARDQLVPCLPSDPTWMFAYRRRSGEEFIEQVRSHGANVG
jgi:hypothetical protein